MIKFHKITRAWAISIGAFVLVFLSASVVLANSVTISLWSGKTGTGTTLELTDVNETPYGRGKTQSSSAVYLQSYNIRAWSNYDYLHLLDEYSNFTYNGTLIEQTQNGAYFGFQPSWITTKHYWQGCSQPICQRRTTYSSHGGNRSTSGCWLGSPCP